MIIDFRGVRSALGFETPIVVYRANYRLDILLPNSQHIVYEMIIGKLQLIAANVK